MVGVFLLLKAKDGRKRPTKTKISVRKGELVEKLDEMIPADRYSGEHNYRILGRHGSVSLCRVERENKMAATYNVLAFKR